MARPIEELPPDNAARIVLFDVMAAVASEAEQRWDGLDVSALFDRVIPRLRVLVPRELHVQGERDYVEAKITACVDACILQWHGNWSGFLVLGPEVPRIRYPDGTIRAYRAGLESARERLMADENRLRRGGFDVRHIVRSTAYDKKSDRYRNLVESIREHGFLDYFPIIEGASGVVEGIARQAAAAELEVPLKKHHRVRLPVRRDTPLHHALLVLDLNADRLSEDEQRKVHEAIEKQTGRQWMAIDDDLALTREWRRAEPREYDAKFEVVLVPFGQQQEPKVQITTDRAQVMLRSVMQQAGLPSYSYKDFVPYVATEEARTQFSGRKAIFVKIADAIPGIERMQTDRASRRLKVDTAWDDIRRWLETLIDSGVTADSDPPEVGAAQLPARAVTDEAPD